jgi:hypothetical protein
MKTKTIENKWLERSDRNAGKLNPDVALPTQTERPTTPGTCGKNL